MSVLIVKRFGERYRYSSVQNLALTYGDWHEDAHLITTQILEVLFEKGLLSTDDLKNILNIYEGEIEVEAKVERSQEPYCHHCGVVDDLHSGLYCRKIKEWKSRSEAHYQNYLQMLDRVDKLVAERGWIPVEERLPKPETFVLTAWKNGMFQVVRITNGKWTTGATVTHWMPIPEVPCQP